MTTNTALSPRRLVLAVTQDPAKYAGLSAIVDTACNAIMAKTNLYGAQVRGDRYDLVLVDAMVGDATGYQIVQALRKLMLHDGDFHIVRDSPTTLDAVSAKQAGAASIVSSDPRVLTALLENARLRLTVPEPVPAPAVAVTRGIVHQVSPDWATNVPISPFVPAVIVAMREFLASEAEPRVLTLYQEMSRKRPHAPVTFDELVDEAAQRLLDDAADRKAFIKFANTQKGVVK